MNQRKTTDELVLEFPVELIEVTRKENIANDTAIFLIERFVPFLEQIQEWKDKALQLTVTSVDQKAEMQMAREARLALRKVRTNADKLREELKQDSLRYGRAVQGIYNVIEAGIKPIEQHLEEQEKFVEREEARKRDELRMERQQMIEGLHQYFPVNIDLGYMTQEDFDRLYNGAVLQKKDAEERAAREEQERIEREQQEASERDRIRRENEELRERIAQEQKEKADRDNLNRARLAELQPFLAFGEPVDVTTLWQLEQGAFEALLKQKEVAFEEQRQKNIAEANARKEAEKKAAAERAERERLEQELRDKQLAEQKAEADRIAALEAEAAKGDKAKFKDILSRLESIKTEFAFKSKKYKTLHAGVCELIDKTIAWAESKN